jgi:hypothetical protein
MVILTTVVFKCEIKIETGFVVDLFCSRKLYGVLVVDDIRLHVDVYGLSTFPGWDFDCLAQESSKIEDPRVDKLLVDFEVHDHLLESLEHLVVMVVFAFNHHRESMVFAVSNFKW